MMINIYIYALIFFLFGTIVGSFLNVVGYRLPKKMSIIFPSSHCPNCNKKLGITELIPIFSYIFQGGKCKKCRKKIEVFYPIFELLTGLLFSVSYLIWGMSPELLVSITFGSILLVVVISDIKYLIIPDELIVFGVVILFIQRLYIGNSAIELVFDAMIPFIVIFMFKLFGDFLFKKESLGGGDIKLMLIFGLAIGWELSLLSVFIASFIALPVSLIILVVKKTNIIPFGPFLSVAALIIYFLRLDISWLLEFIV